MILLDTNILIYATDTTAPFHKNSKKLRDNGLQGTVSLCVTSQVLLEFFAVVTSSKRIVNPIEPQKAIEEIDKYLEAEKIIKIYPNKDTFSKIIDLSKKYNIKSQEIFDIQLVATMLSNNVTEIYTYDTGHFSKIKEILVLTP